MITKFLRYTGIGLIFLTTFIPLYVDNGLFFPFITGKAFAFRIIVEIAFALWLLLMLRDKKYAPQFSWITIGVTVFTVVALIADLAGVNPVRSLWSNFERMEGWVTIIHLWAYFIAAAGFFGPGEEGRRMWHNFFKTSLVAAGIVGIYGFFQLFGWAAIHQGSARIDASLGNAAYMAVYMLFHVFIAFYFSIVAYEKRNKGSMWWYFILGLIFAFLLFETATRGTILGLVGGILLALALFGIFGKEESGKARGSALGVIILLVLLGAGLVAAKNTNFVKKSETLNRLASISWESAGQARQYIWPMAIKGTLQNPKTAIIGWGQENFNYIFNANYNPKMWGQEQWFDRAHSVWLDWLVAAGILGLVLYLSLFIFAVRAIWISDLSFREKCLLTGLFVGYGIHNIFVFDNLASYILFFTMLGFVHTLSAKRAISWFEIRDEQTENMIVVRDYIYFPIILILFIATFYFVNVRVIQANKRLIAAMTACAQNKSDPALFEKALALNQYVANQEIREQLYSCANGAILSQGYSQDVKGKFYLLANSEIAKQNTATPNDARGYLIGGVFLDGVGDWKNGQTLLEKANQLSPNKQSIMTELALNYLNTKRESDALDTLKKAYEEAPENDNAKLAYASALILLGQESKAKEFLPAEDPFWKSQRFIGLLNQTKQYSRAIDILTTSIKDDPSYDNYAALATMYYQTGNKGAALSTLQVMKDKFILQKDTIQGAIDQINNEKK